MIENVVIIGSGGLARDIAASMNKKIQKKYNLLGFIDDFKPVQTIVNNNYILGSIEWLIKERPCNNIILGFSNINERVKITQRLKIEGFNFPTFIHPNANILDLKNIHIGIGTIVMPYSVITTNVSIGNHVLVHIGTRIHHDTSIGDNCIIMPNVSITGGAKIGDDVYIGTASILPLPINISNKVKIEAGSLILSSIN
jgi:sugar O-acyltransferase (sialic acid O-acetyltransferase NeuD family)